MIDTRNLAVVILNWNSWKDTCECLTSLFNSTYKNFQVILIDNGSEDGSIGKIKAWAQGKLPVVVGPYDTQPKVYHPEFKEHSLEAFENITKTSDDMRKTDILFVRCPSNLGFARGCNVGIRYALSAGFEYVLLLNNDTTLDRDCLNVLYEFIRDSQEYDVVTPIIYYYDQPEIVWYFGGELTFTGRRKIYYLNRKSTKIRLPEYKKSTFASGCALFARTSIFEKYGLLTERFFFGEEDYDFSLRMRENNIRMIAVSSAKVYHKVGTANKKIFRQDRLPYAFVGYLNRFIDKKLHCRSIGYWKIWRLICLSYILPKLIMIHRYRIDRIFRFARMLVQYSTDYDHVNKDIFFQVKGLLQ